MSDARLAAVARSLRVELEPDRPAGSMSGSQVHRVRRRDGTPAILKATFAATGEALPRSAIRELAVYTELSDQLPIRVPTLLDHRVSTDTVALLLTEHQRGLPPTDWSRQHWLSMAHDLGRLHDTVPPSEQVDDPESWLIAALRAPTPPVVLDFWNRPGERELLAPILDSTEMLITAISTPDRCLTHGDCHTDNVLVEGTQLIWTDWQGCGIGDPACELAFASSRATPSGAKPPLTEMIIGYADHRGIDVDAFAHAVLAAELSILIFGWPEYARYNSAAGVDRIRRRTYELARRWQH